MTSRHFFVWLALVSAMLVVSTSAQAEPPLPPRDAPDRFTPYPPPSPRNLPPPDVAYSYREPNPYPSIAWMITQLVPSPEIALGREDASRGPFRAGGEPNEAAFGLRWQLTPVLWSWGTNRRISRWRFFVVDPMARQSGSLELSTSIEYLWGHIDRALVRPGVRTYIPLAQRGEYLSASLGTSIYRYDDTLHVAYDVGAYILFGLFGVQVTIAPDHAPLAGLATFRIRYF